MSPPRPAIVVSLPARTVSEARRQAAEARDGGAQFAELRLDRWTPSEWARVAELFPAPLPLIATLRSRMEGGEGPNDPVSRKEILETVAAEPFEWIDLEGARDRPLEPAIETRGRRIIRSYHLDERVSEAELRSRLQEASAPNLILKVVLPASFSRVVEQLIPLAEDAVEPRPILLTTGPSGSLWRAWTARLGIPWVFASLPERSAVGSVEPAQIPVDQMAAFFAAPEAPLFALLGHPVAHSRSPAIHQQWIRRAGRTALYLSLDLHSAAEFRLAMEILPSRGFRGANVTHPWKPLAFEGAGERSGDALATGVANCLTFRDGRIVADNTDLGAVQRRLGELKEGGQWDGTNLVVLGGGGAARATLAAAQRIGCTATVLTRRPSQAAALATEFDARVGDLASPERSHLVVHATQVGRTGVEELDLPLASVLSPGGYLLDWVYAPADPRLAEVARAAGANYEDGSRLLVYQAAASFARWWGEPPDPEWIRELVREAGCAA
jgi:shikimate dehydrogenase